MFVSKALPTVEIKTIKKKSTNELRLKFWA
jgi:hypothetical protein